MDDNVKLLVADLTSANCHLTELETKLRILKRFVDAEEIRCKKRGYSVDIEISIIRKILGWDNPPVEEDEDAGMDE